MTQKLTNREIREDQSYVDIATLQSDIRYIKQSIEEIKHYINDLKGNYITREEFEPIKRIVYGIITVLGLATLGAIFKLIFK